MAAGAGSSSSSRASRRDRFNPGVIVLQIVVLQAAYYIALALLATGMNRAIGVTDADLSAQVLGSRSRGAAWRIAALSTLLAAAGPAALVLALLVRRARRCADHAVTLLALHVCLSSMAHGIPLRPLWWALHIAAAVLMGVVAETACRLIEAREREAFKLDLETSSADVEDPVNEEVVDSSAVDENTVKTRSEEEVSLLVQAE